MLPRALVLDEATCVAAEMSSKLGVPQNPTELVHEIRWVAGREQEPGLTVPNKLPVASHARCDERLSHRHGFEGFQRRHRLREAHRQSWINENIDQVIVTSDLVEGDPARKGDPICEPHVAHAQAKRLVARSGTDEQRPRLGLFWRSEGNASKRRSRPS